MALLLSSAIFFALSWLQRHSDQDLRAVIRYDSTYAAAMAQRQWRPRRNASLVLNCWRVLDSLHCRVDWEHVYSHTGQFLNERVDALAKAFASGTELSWPREALRSLVGLPNVPQVSTAPT